MTVQLSNAPEEHGFGLKRRLRTPFGILPARINGSPY